MRVALYARVSTKDKSQHTDNQLADLRRYAQAQGYEVYKKSMRRRNRVAQPTATNSSSSSLRPTSAAST